MKDLFRPMQEIKISITNYKFTFMFSDHHLRKSAFQKLASFFFLLFSKSAFQKVSPIFSFFCFHL